MITFSMVASLVWPSSTYNLRPKPLAKLPVLIVSPDAVAPFTVNFVLVEMSMLDGYEHWYLTNDAAGAIWTVLPSNDIAPPALATEKEKIKLLKMIMSV